MLPKCDEDAYGATQSESVLRDGLCAYARRASFFAALAFIGVLTFLLGSIVTVTPLAGECNHYIEASSPGVRGGPLNRANARGKSQRSELYAKKVDPFGETARSVVTCTFYRALHLPCNPGEEHDTRDDC